MNSTFTYIVIKLQNAKDKEKIKYNQRLKKHNACKGITTKFKSRLAKSNNNSQKIDGKKLAVTQNNTNRIIH